MEHLEISDFIIKHDAGPSPYYECELENGNVICVEHTVTGGYYVGIYNTDRHLLGKKELIEFTEPTTQNKKVERLMETVNRMVNS